MKAISAYIKGWGLSLRHFKMWGLLYIFNLLFALLLTFPTFQFLNGKLSNTLAIDKMFHQFDFTIFNDILGEYGDIVGILTNQSILSSLLFLLLSIFLTGGVLNVFRHRDVPFRFAGFWVGCSKFFWRLFGLTILFLLIQGIVLVAFFFIFNGLTAGGLDRFENEAAIYHRALLVFPFYAFFAMLFWMLQDYIKIVMVDKDISLFRSIGQGIRFVFRNFFSTFFLYLLNALTFVGVLYLYWQIPSGNAIVFGFIIGQLFLFLRIGTKLLNLGSATILYGVSSDFENP